MDPNREFHELLGKCWHDLVPNDWPHNRLLPIKHFKCTKCDIYTNSCEADINPDYAADPRLVLREMDRLGKLSAFMMWLWDSESCEDDLGNVLMSGESFLHLLDYILDTTGKLRDEAIKFMKEIKDDSTI